MKLLFMICVFFLVMPNAYALTGIVNVNDSLTLRDAPTTGGNYLTSFYNGTEVTILDTRAGSGNGCGTTDGAGYWYKVQYGGYTGYSCGNYIVLKQETTVNTEDDSYSKSNYDNVPSHDGTIMCYEDTGSLGLRSGAASDNRTGKKVDCGEKVNILETVDTSGNTCPYWYKIQRGGDTGYVCGYYVNTTKLSSTAQNYYNNQTNGDTIENYKARLAEAKFPESYHSYLLEIHARHPNWNFVAEVLNVDFNEAVNGEAAENRNVLEGSAFNEGYFSMASHTYNIFTNAFTQAGISDPGYYNASKEAIAYYLDPRNYLNEKYIFAFETLEYNNNQSNSVVSSIISAQGFFNSIYANVFGDGTGSASGDIVKASSEVGISAVHVASRIRQEMGTQLTTTDSRLGGGFTYNGASTGGYYNFFNIKSSCTSCSSVYAGYAYEKGWNTPYKGIYGGASFMYNGYISINQDTLYYEKFDVSTTNGHYAHQYMQNLAAPPQETTIMYNRLIQYGASNYFNTGITFVIPVYNNMPAYAVTAPKLGSNNNYLQSLTVNGNSVSNFSYNTYNYNIYLAKNTTSVSIDATPILGSASVVGTGNIAINSDEQTNQVIVTSQSGKTRVYTIKFIRETMESTTVADAMEHSGFKYNDNHLFGIEIGTNVSHIIGNISSYNHAVGVVVKDKAGNIKTNDSFRTGDTVTIIGIDGQKTYTVLIYGDVDGDGTISKKDLLAVQSKVFGYTNFDDLKTVSGDINKDGTVDKKDLLAVQSHVFGYSQIKQG